MKQLYRKMNGNEPAVVQCVVNGWNISWNPDDERFYVVREAKTRTFKRWANATYYARTH